MASAAGRFRLWVKGCARGGVPMDSVGGDGDGDWAFGSFFEEGALGFLLVLGSVGIDELHVARAEDFEAIVEFRAGSERLGSEAGTGVVDFEQAHGLRGAVAYGGFDVGGVAAGDDQDREERKNAEMTHGVKGIRVDERGKYFEDRSKKQNAGVSPLRRQMRRRRSRWRIFLKEQDDVEIARARRRGRESGPGCGRLGLLRSGCRGG